MTALSIDLPMLSSLVLSSLFNNSYAVMCDKSYFISLLPVSHHLGQFSLATDAKKSVCSETGHYLLQFSSSLLLPDTFSFMAVGKSDGWGWVANYYDRNGLSIQTSTGLVCFMPSLYRVTVP